MTLRASTVRALDRATLIGISLGIACMLQPWWSGGFRAGFFLTALFAVLQVVASHLPSRSGP